MIRLPVLCALLALASAASAASAAQTIRQRFADAQSAEQPSFQRHVLPLMSKVGCSGRSCHGSFQGAGGFRLSLFGYDFQADHAAMTTGDEPRIDLAKPADSLIVRKPSGLEKHKGKKLFEVGSWQYNILHKWAAGGAKDDSKDHTHLSHLEVLPREMVFKKAGETAQLKVLAHWGDGRVEDVTDITRFRTNDEAVAKVDEQTGIVVAEGPGDTHIVAFYDNGVHPVPAMLPVSDKAGTNYPAVAASTKVDQLIVDKLRKLGILPSELCSDEEFLRRASLDVCGTLPHPNEVRQFLADRSTDKRARKVEELLSRPSYAAWWATKLCDITGNNASQLRQGGTTSFSDELSRMWYDWIAKRVADNTPYDQMIAGIVLGSSRLPDQSYTDYCAEMSSYFRRNDPADFAQRPSMPYFWMRQNVRKPEEKSLAFAYTFLGVRLQCAECHKHPFDQWTQADFKAFQAFFNGVETGSRSYNGRNTDPETKKILDDLGVDVEALRKMGNNKFSQEITKLCREGKVIPFEELRFRPETASRAKGKNDKNSKLNGNSRVVTPRVLGGEEVMLANFEDPRQPLMDWMRDPQNPYFAKAWVNRVWAHYFGVGIVNPADDLNLANPPANAELLDYLSHGFIASGFDMKWLHRQVLTSDAYQRSWKTNETNKLDKRNFSHAVIRRIPAEVAMDALKMASASSQQLDKMHGDMDGRYIAGAGGHGGGRGGQANYALGVFGKPDRMTNCDCERSDAPTLLQSIFLSNDQELYSIFDKGGWIREVAGGAGGKNVTEPQFDRKEMERIREKFKDLPRDQQKAAVMAEYQKLRATPAPAGSISTLRNDPDLVVEELFLRTVSRKPTAEERSNARQHLQSAADQAEALRDLLWVMVNTKEFIINH